MLDFPKYYKQNDNKKFDVDKKKNKKNTNKKVNLSRLPLNISDPLDYKSLFKINMVDFFCKYYNFFGLDIETSLYSYFHNKSIKPIEKNAVIKQKKEVIKFIKHFQIPRLSEKEHSTLSEEFTSKSRIIFSEFVRKGIIKESYNIISWSNELQTVISNDDAIEKSIVKKLYTVKYFISTKNNSLDLNIFDLELIFADVAVAIHPAHKKAKLLKGKEVIIPITNRKIPIIIDERADFGTCGGIRRITPGHDSISLDIAKDHNLPIDIYAFDEKGYFTEYAGAFQNKKVEDFLGNIVQNLADIGNLIDTRQETENILFSKKTGERLISRSYKGWFLEIIDTIGYKRCISSLNSFGVRLPVRKDKEGNNIIIDEKFILSKFADISSKKHNAIMSIIIFNLIADGYIANSFSLESLIEILFNNGLTSKDTTLAKYMDIFNKYYDTKPYKRDFESLDELNDLLGKNKNTKDFEIIIDKLIYILSNTFCVTHNEKDNKYRFDFEILDKSLDGAIQTTNTFNDYFLNGLLLLDSIGTFDNKFEDKFSKNNIENFIIFEEEQKQHIEKYAIIGEMYNNKKARTKFITIPDLFDKNENKVSGYKNGLIDLNCIKEYGSNSLRFNLLTSQNKENNTYDENRIEECYLGISTFWNCCRYIKTTLIKDQYKGSLCLKDIKKLLEKNTDKFNAFDIWLLSKTKIILQEFVDIQDKGSIGDFGNSIIDFIKKDFSNKYLELIKANPSDISNNMSVFVVGIFIKLLYPYIPDISASLRDLMEFEGNIEEELPAIGFDDLQKNYLIELFMELVDKFLLIKSGLKLKKHSPISMFIKSNQDFIKFTKSNEQLLKKTLHAEDIQYLTHQDNIPSGYINQEIIDITIGVKEFSQEKPKSIYSLQKLLENKQEHLQNIKVLLNTINSSGDILMISQKKEEIQTIKEEIEKLILEINKLKIRE